MRSQLTKLSVATALLVAIAVPTFAGAAAGDGYESCAASGSCSEYDTGSVSFSVNKAIEVDADATANLGSGAPQAGGTSGSVTSSVSTDVRSNATWGATVQSNTTGMTASDGTNTAASKLQVSATNGSYADITASNGTPVTIASGQDRNGVATGTTGENVNAAQALTVWFNQPISWGDPASATAYSLTVRQNVSN